MTANASISGILLLNKPQGLTSNAALQRVKKLFNLKKAGHTGSLDPLATGMLPICFGEATKFSQYLLNADKCYETTGQLGVITDTSDSTGKAISTVKDFHVSLIELEKAIESFRGKQKQIPSMYSALKHKGKPLYEYARAGIEIERKERDINISLIDINDFDGINFNLTVCCSKGTYIRNLIEDIGKNLGPGAHLTRLHRVYTGAFKNHKMYSLQDLEDISYEERVKLLLPVDASITEFPILNVSSQEKLALSQGKRIECYDNYNPETLLRIYCNGEFIGLAETLENEQIKTKRLLSTVN